MGLSSQEPDLICIKAFQPHITRASISRDDDFSLMTIFNVIIPPQLVQDSPGFNMENLMLKGWRDSSWLSTNWNNGSSSPYLTPLFASRLKDQLNIAQARCRGKPLTLGQGGLWLKSMRPLLRRVNRSLENGRVDYKSTKPTKKKFEIRSSKILSYRCSHAHVGHRVYANLLSM